MATAIRIDKLGLINNEMQSQENSPKPRAPVFVLFTSLKQTLKALEKAIQLAQPLHKEIEILVVQTVPYPLPLDEPPVSNDFLLRQLTEAAKSFSTEIRISVYLCRNPIEALERTLNRNCPMVMGVQKKNWWPTRDRKSVRTLRRSGFDVIAVETE
jgi:hypothetical protein